jgi:hypothetical protein
MPFGGGVTRRRFRLFAAAANAAWESDGRTFAPATVSRSRWRATAVPGGTAPQLPERYR